MKHFLLLALLTSLAAVARAESYAERSDVQAFVVDMHDRHGFGTAALSALFHRIRPSAAVLKAISPPTDPRLRSWHAYRGRFVEPRRIAAGRRFLHDHATALAAAETRFGVPREIIVAILGIETIYGRQKGHFATFAALATLSFDYPPRAELFRQELEELLLLAREEGRHPLSYTGSYAGALGMPQFLPSSRRRFAIDFDGDGRIDLAASTADAIGSVTNFLATHGWQKNEPTAIVVTVTGSGVQSLVDQGITPQRTPAEMALADVSLAGVGAGDTAIPEQPAALIDLATPSAATEYRLGYRNFYVITRYNRSSFYAAAVIDLADALRASQ